MNEIIPQQDSFKTQDKCVNHVLKIEPHYNKNIINVIRSGPSSVSLRSFH